MTQTSRTAGIMAAAVAVAVLAEPPGRGRQPADNRPQETTLGAPPTRIVISEVLFNPTAGETPFVELLNTAAEAVNLSRMTLRVGDSVVLLARAATPLEPGMRLVVRFDGQGRVDGHVVHAPGSIVVHADGGFVDLRDEQARRVDFVAWGDENGAFDRNSSGLFDDAPTRPGGLARAPEANAPMNPADWVAYDAAEATPGVENPMPAADMLIPFDGEAVDGPTGLFWYPVAGAARYRVQVAATPRFDAPLLLDRTVTETQIDAVTLEPGQYFWRVQTISADGRSVAVSAPNGLEIRGRTDSGDEPLAEGPSTQAVVPPPLPVPMLRQHKDSLMLSLEVNQRKGSHAWNTPHADYDSSDPADATNCVAASVAMVNHYFGGDLSQDRIGYEALGRNGAQYAAGIDAAGLRPSGVAASELKERSTGPEWDLIFGKGLNGAQLLAAVAFGLSPAGSSPGSILPTRGRYGSASEIWDAILPQITNNRPVIGVRKNQSNNGNHAFVVRGLGQDPGTGRRFLIVNDPIAGQRRPYIDGLQTYQPSDFVWVFLPPNPTGRRQEPGVSADSDHDGIVDFDETERFHTDPNNPDTDKDGVWDGNDVASGIFDATYGYARNPVPGSQGRDFDGDYVPTELDPDSDGGGCADGVEDADNNGLQDQLETWNFFPDDDICRAVNGHVTYIVEAERPGDVSIYSNEEFSVSVALRPETPGKFGPLVDNGSRYSMRHVGQIEISGDATCRIIGRTEGSGSGDFTDPDSSVGGYIDPDELVIGAGAHIPGTNTADLCFMSGTSPETVTGGLGDCAAKRVSKTGPTYAFDCHAPPTPAPPGFVITKWSMTGKVTLSVNPTPIHDIVARWLSPPRTPAAHGR